MNKTETQDHARPFYRRWGAFALVLALTLGALFWATTQGRKNLVKTAASLPECSTFVELVDKAGMTSVLAEDGPFTVFIPTNEAFAKLPQDRLAKIANDRSALSAVLLYHMSPETLSAKELARPGERKTCVVPATSISVSSQNYGDASFVRKNVPCVNGIVYVVDAVQIPPFMTQNDLAAPPQPKPEEIALVASENIVAGAAPLADPRREAKVDSALENAAETVKTQTVEAVAGAANVVKDGAARVVEKGAEGLSRVADAVQAGAENAVDDAQKAEPQAQEAAEKTEEAVEETKKDAQEAAEKTENAAQEAAEKAETPVEESTPSEPESEPETPAASRLPSPLSRLAHFSHFAQAFYFNVVDARFGRLRPFRRRSNRFPPFRAVVRDVAPFPPN